MADFSDLKPLEDISEINEQIAKDLPRTSFLSKLHTVADLKRSWLYERETEAFNFIQGSLTGRVLTDIPLSSYQSSKFQSGDITPEEAQLTLCNVEAVFKDKQGKLCAISVSYLKSQPSKFILSLINHASDEIIAREVWLLGSSEFFKEVTAVDKLSTGQDISCAIPSKLSEEALANFFTHIGDELVADSFKSLFKFNETVGGPQLIVDHEKAKAHARRYYRDEALMLVNENIDRWPQAWCLRQIQKIGEWEQQAASPHLRELYKQLEAQLSFLASRPYTEVYEEFSKQQQLVSSLMSKLDGSTHLDSMRLALYHRVVGELLPILLVAHSIDKESDLLDAEFPAYVQSVNKLYDECINACNEHHIKVLEKRVDKITRQARYFQEVKACVMQSSQAAKTKVTRENEADSYLTLLSTAIAHKANSERQAFLAKVREAGHRRFTFLDELLELLTIDEYQKLTEATKQHLITIATLHADYHDVFHVFSRNLPQADSVLETLNHRLLLSAADRINNQSKPVLIADLQRKLEKLKWILAICKDCSHEQCNQLIPIINHYLAVSDDVLVIGADVELEERFEQSGEFLAMLIEKAQFLEALSEIYWPKKSRKLLSETISCLVKWLLEGIGDFQSKRQQAQRLLSSVDLAHSIGSIQARFSEEINKTSSHVELLSQLEQQLYQFQEKGEHQLESLTQRSKDLFWQFRLRAFLDKYVPKAKRKAPYIELPTKFSDTAAVVANRLDRLESYVASAQKMMQQAKKLSPPGSVLVLQAQETFDNLILAITQGQEAAPFIKTYWSLTNRLSLVTKLKELFHSMDYLPDYQDKIDAYIKRINSEHEPPLVEIYQFLKHFDDLGEIMFALESKHTAVMTYFDDGDVIRVAFEAFIRDCHRYLLEGGDALREMIIKRFDLFKKLLPSLINFDTNDKQLVKDLQLAKQLKAQIIADINANDFDAALHKADFFHRYIERCRLLDFAEAMLADISVFTEHQQLKDTVISAGRVLEKGKLSSDEEEYFYTLKRLKAFNLELLHLAQLPVVLSGSKLLPNTTKQAQELKKTLFQYVVCGDDVREDFKQRVESLEIKQQLAAEISSFAESLHLDLEDKKTRNFIKGLLHLIDQEDLLASQDGCQRVQRIKGSYPLLLQQFSILHLIEHSLCYDDEEFRGSKQQLAAIMKSKTKALKASLDFDNEEMMFYRTTSKLFDEREYLLEIDKLKLLLERDELFKGNDVATSLKQELNELHQRFIQELITASMTKQSLVTKKLQQSLARMKSQALKTYKGVLNTQLKQNKLAIKKRLAGYSAFKITKTSETFTRKLQQLSQKCKELDVRFEFQIKLSLNALNQREQDTLSKFKEINELEKSLHSELAIYFSESITGFIRRVDALCAEQQRIDRILGSTTSMKIEVVKQRLRQFQECEQLPATIYKLDSVISSIDTKLNDFECKQQAVNLYARQYGRSFIHRHLGTTLFFGLMAVATMVGVGLLASGVFSPIGSVILGLSALKIASIVTGVCGGLALMSGCVFYRKRKKAREAEQAVDVFRSALDKALGGTEPTINSGCRMLKRFSSAPALNTPSPKRGFFHSASCSQLRAKEGFASIFYQGPEAPKQEEETVSTSLSYNT